MCFGAGKETDFRERGMKIISLYFASTSVDYGRISVNTLNQIKPVDLRTGA